MSDDIIHDISRFEYNNTDRVSLDFRLDVPKAPHEDLKSSATIEEGLVEEFELRLGLLAQERYDADDIRETMNAILAEMDLPRTRYRAMREELEEASEHDSDGMLPDADPEDEIIPKIAYDPHWGELGYWQVHLQCHSFWPPILDEDEFEAFVREFTREFVERMEWDDD